MRLIDADVLERDGWRMSRIVPIDEKTMELQTRKLTDFPTVELQPELLTDREKRIFLAAMVREEKICKQVDDECGDCGKPWVDSLVKTCHEIKRKVKGTLWRI